MLLFAFVPLQYYCISQEGRRQEEAFVNRAS